MRLHAAFLVLFAIVIHFTKAQTAFTDLHFGDPASNNRGSSCIPDNHGGAWFAGTFSNGIDGSDDIGLYRINPDGEIIWSVTYGDGRNDYVNMLMQADEDLFLLCGDVRDPATDDLNAFVIAVDSSGSVLWAQEYGDAASNEEFYCMAMDTDGSVILTGFHTAMVGSGNDILLVRYSVDGNFVQDVVFGSERNDVGMAIVVLPGGNFVVSGDRQTPEGIYNPFLAKLNADLDLLSDADLVSPHNSGCKSMHLYGEDTLILCGETASFASPEFDVLLIRADTSFSISLQYGVPSAGPDAAYDVVMLQDGTFAFTGFSYDPGKGENSMLFLHTDSEGLQLDRRYFGETGADLGYDIKLDAAGNCWMAGFHTNADTVFFALVVDQFDIDDEILLNETIEPGIRIFPDPISDDFCISSNMQVDKIVIYNAAGSRVGELQHGGDTCFLWPQPLAAGIYYIQMYTSVGNFTKKIMAE